MNTDKLIYNGQLVTRNTLLINPENRAFRYGDGVFETMHYYKGQILFIRDHFNRLKDGMKKLRMKSPEGLSITHCIKLVNKLIKINQIKSDARIRLQVFRNDGGYYGPVTSQSSYVITVGLVTEGFFLNKKGITITILPEKINFQPAFLNIKSCNSLPYVLAGIYAEEQKKDDCFILNGNNKITEAISSNVFIVKKGKIYTPPLSDGCVAGVMRKNIILISKQIQIGCREKSLTIKDLHDADEIFLTDVISGIRWVGKIGNHIKEKNMVIKLCAALNKQISSFKDR